MDGAGIDIGARTTKLVVIEDGRVTREEVRDTGANPLAVCRELVSDLGGRGIVATGYGRRLFHEHFPRSVMVTELTAVARGAREVEPACRTIIDIGGQDTKAITLDAAGRMHKFVMNDRCAAGTGQFLELMALALALTREGFEAAADRAARAQELSSMCSVFAQSEVVSLIARGVPVDEIARGVLQTIARRVAGMAGGLPIADPIVFTGGCAKSDRLARLLGEALGRPVRVPASPQTVTALGAAWLDAGRAAE